MIEPKPTSPRSPGIAYRLLSLPLLLFWHAHAIFHGRKHGLPQYAGLRRAPASPAAASATLWVHASSVGEVRCAEPLVSALLERGERVWFTCFTATGYEAIRQCFDDRVTRDVIPFDFVSSCRRFFAGRELKLGLVVETELWPELLYQARRHGIPLLLVNARLSARTANVGFPFRGLLRNTLTCFDRILARNSADRDRFRDCGVEPSRIEVVGNLKSVNTGDADTQRLIDDDYLLLASSHGDEERRFMQSRPEALRDRLVVIAPRHPERAAEIEAALGQLGLLCARRSRGDAITPKTAVYLADTLGELRSLMAHARVVVMGGSFDDTGGHNLIEPAALGCATITGPSDSNIRDDIQMLGDGVVQVGDLAQCWRIIGELLEDPARRAAIGQAAKLRLAQQPDMVARYVNAISPWL